VNYKGAVTDMFARVTFIIRSVADRHKDIHAPNRLPFGHAEAPVMLRLLQVTQGSLSFNVVDTASAGDRSVSHYRDKVKIK